MATFKPRFAVFVILILWLAGATFSSPVQYVLAPIRRKPRVSFMIPVTNPDFCKNGSVELERKCLLPSTNRPSDWYPIFADWCLPTDFCHPIFATRFHTYYKYRNLIKNKIVKRWFSAFYPVISECIRRRWEDSAMLPPKNKGGEAGLVFVSRYNKWLHWKNPFNLVDFDNK